jgi:chitinase
MKYIIKIITIFLILSLGSVFANDTVVEQKDSKNIYAKTDLLPKRLIGGFLDIRSSRSTSRIDVQKVKDDGYNLIIIGFGEVYGTDVSFDFSKDASKLNKQAITDKITQAKKLGIPVLLGVGGIPNSFHPGVNVDAKDPKVLGKSMSLQQTNALAANIVAFVKNNDLDGVDFSIRKYMSSSFFKNLTTKIKELDPSMVVAVEPAINNYRLVTKGTSNGFDDAIQSGNIDYLFLQEYNVYPQYDPNYITESYSKIIENTKIPLNTKILIGEPTNAVAGGMNTIYHPDGSGSKSLSTEDAVSLMLPQLDQLKHKPRFAGIIGWSLNTDYASDLYGDKNHTAGSFAKSLKACIYDNTCIKEHKPEGPIVAGYLSLAGSSLLHSSSGHTITSTPIDIKLPKDKEYCDVYPNVCKYNVIIAAYLTLSEGDGFRPAFGDQKNSDSKKAYSPDELKKFVKYMKSKGKHVIVSINDKSTSWNWYNINLNTIAKIVNKYGFNGINIDLADADLPKTDKLTKYAADKIKEAIGVITKNHKDKNDFWLTFSPSWDYITPYIGKDSNESIFKENHRYVDILDKIGLDNINYIFLKTSSLGATTGVFGPYQNQENEYKKISPSDSYSNFLTSLVWSLTTQDGYNANISKYKQEALIIPPKKLVLLIPAVKGAMSKDDVYTLNPQDIDTTVKQIEENKASFGGFAVWDIDLDATTIKSGQLGGNYSHQPWSITDAIANISLPDPVGQVTNTPKKKEYNDENIIETDIINYPKHLGSYLANTIVELQGKKYKCLSMDVVDLCNDKSYIPNGLYGYLAWGELDENNSKKYASKNEFPVYPDKIGNYVENQKVKAGVNKVFQCIDGKQALCNNIIYAPAGDKGYKAWANITSNLSYSSSSNSRLANEQKPEGAQYIYPDNIENYVGGTIVAIDKDLYRCKVGPSAKLCLIKTYTPDGKYGLDAWERVK